MKNIHQQRIILIALAIIGMISIFLPWVKGVDGNITMGIKSKGFYSWGALIALASVLILCTFGETNKPLHGFLKYLTILLCAIAASLGIIKVLETLGFGLILLLICCIGGFMAAINLDTEKEIKE